MEEPKKIIGGTILAIGKMGDEYIIKNKNTGEYWFSFYESTGPQSLLAQNIAKIKQIISCVEITKLNFIDMKTLKQGDRQIPIFFFGTDQYKDCWSDLTLHPTYEWVRVHDVIQELTHLDFSGTPFLSIKETR